MLPTNKEQYAAVVAYVKARVARWPSAYASGMVVQRYKAAMAARGEPAYVPSSSPATPGLTRWFKEKWTDIRTGKPCGAAKTGAYYPTCRPTVRVTAATPKLARDLTARQKGSMIRQKQKVGPAKVDYPETNKSR
jgi:hypothetical protein